MTVYLVISLPKIPYRYMVLANPRYVHTSYASLQYAAAVSE